MKLALSVIICVTAVKSSSLKGKPVPGAKVLDQVLSKYLNRSDYTDTIFDFLRGDDNARRSVNLDMGVLDRDNVQAILNTIKKRNQADYRRYDKYEAYYVYPESNAIKETALDMMKQSIYGTKFRMNETRRFRKFYTDNPSFHIGMYYGALMQISTKLETLFTIIKKLDAWTHFLWFLVIYEKILAANVDAHDMVDRIYDLHEKYGRILKREKVELAPTLPIPDETTTRMRRRRTRSRPMATTTFGWKPDGDNKRPDGDRPGENYGGHFGPDQQRPDFPDGKPPGQDADDDNDNDGPPTGGPSEEDNRRANEGQLINMKRYF